MRALLAVFCSFPLLQEAEITYTDEEVGFSVGVPKGWSLTRTADKVACLTMRPPISHDNILSFILRAESPENAGGVKPQDWIDQVKKDYPKRLKEFELIRAEAGKHEEYPSLRLAYKYRSGERMLGQIQYMVWARQHYFVLTWSCLEDQFDANREMFEKYSRAFKTKVKK